MHIPRYGRNRSIEFDMTPLIDVVFLLIVFFLVSSHLAQQETQLELDLPTASSANPQTETTAQRVTLNVLPDGRLLMGGNEADAGEIAARLAVERGKVSGDLEVRIRTDRGVPFGKVEPLLMACVEAGVWNVTFAVIENTTP